METVLPRSSIASQQGLGNGVKGNIPSQGKLFLKDICDYFCGIKTQFKGTLLYKPLHCSWVVKNFAYNSEGGEYSVKEDLKNI
jgi:hypothetical protein